MWCFSRDWVVVEVRNERDWRICFGLEDVWREERRLERVCWRSCSEITEESRREDEEGEYNEARVFIRDYCQPREGNSG